MEKAKNDDQNSRRFDFYSQSFAFIVIGLVFVMLTVMTSYDSFNVLPLPEFFYVGSIISAFLLLFLSGDMRFDLRGIITTKA